MAISENYLKKYETFLKEIDLSKYSKLREIKTVEQDLPKSLNPLPLIYKYYWEERNFIDYDEFFKIYWGTKLHHIMEFIKKYFYGCSLQFVEEGFKARLYRTWISLLTQFHFQYLWVALFEGKYPLEASAELDMAGIDSRITINGVIAGIQIKKISYRREASQRRFTKKQRKLVDIICEVPYLVIDIEEAERKLSSNRTRESTKRKLSFLLEFFNRNFKVLKNGFVVFRKEYLWRIRQILICKSNALQLYKDSSLSFLPYTAFLPEVS